MADFGISEFTNPDEKPSSKLGTFNWLAPEIFNGESYTKAADVFSYGMVLWEILTGEQPYMKLRCVPGPPLPHSLSSSCSSSFSSHCCPGRS